MRDIAALYIKIIRIMKNVAPPSLLFALSSHIVIVRVNACQCACPEETVM